MPTHSSPLYSAQNSPNQPRNTLKSWLLQTPSNTAQGCKLEKTLQREIVAAWLIFPVSLNLKKSNRYIAYLNNPRFYIPVTYASLLWYNEIKDYDFEGYDQIDCGKCFNIFYKHTLFWVKVIGFLLLQDTFHKWSGRQLLVQVLGARGPMVGKR